MSKVRVIDFGGQYTHLIAKRIRNLNVYSEIVPHSISASMLRDSDAIILSGGPSSVNDDGAPLCDPGVFNLDIPVLGICYGMQLIAKRFGGRIEQVEKREYGNTQIRIKTYSRLLEGLGVEDDVWMSHGDSVVSYGYGGFDVLATTNSGLLAAIGNDSRRIYGVQFHPEVTHTKKGDRILGNFLFNISECEPDWTMESYIEKTQKEIEERVGNNDVLVLASGGVDSTVAATVTTNKLGPDRVHLLHIDNGLMRKDESYHVEQALRKAGLTNLRVADRSSDFLGALYGITDPQEKRRIIGNVFIDVMEDELEKMGLDWNNLIFMQGTLYTDWIESGGGVGGEASQIKLHHNVSPRVMELIKQGKVIEPNKWIYKDEVRAVGELLGICKGLVWRHPFPGPGLGIRLVFNPYKPDNFEVIDKDVSAIAGDHGLGGYIVPIATVGVQGDERSYRNLAIISGGRDMKKAKTVASEIVKNTPVNRVAYSISDTAATIKTRVEINDERLFLLREADNKATELLDKHGIYSDISQMPVVMFPDHADEKYRGPAIGLRPVITDDFMTARPAIPGKDMSWEYFDDICKYTAELGLGRVVLDLTDKPPGTIEWE